MSISLTAGLLFTLSLPCYEVKVQDPFFFWSASMDDGYETIERLETNWVGRTAFPSIPNCYVTARAGAEKVAPRLLAYLRFVDRYIHWYAEVDALATLPRLNLPAMFRNASDGDTWDRRIQPTLEPSFQNGREFKEWWEEGRGRTCLSASGKLYRCSREQAAKETDYAVVRAPMSYGYYWQNRALGLVALGEKCHDDTCEGEVKWDFDRGRQAYSVRLEKGDRRTRAREGAYLGGAKWLAERMDGPWAIDAPRLKTYLQSFSRLVGVETKTREEAVAFWKNNSKRLRISKDELRLEVAKTK